MAEYIKKEAVINFIEKGLNNPDKTKSFGHDAIEIMAEVQYMPAADVVQVKTIERWLYEMAMNNVGIKFDGGFSDACQVIISRLDGFRNFAKERMDGDTE